MADIERELRTIVRLHRRVEHLDAEADEIRAARDQTIRDALGLTAYRSLARGKLLARIRERTGLSKARLDQIRRESRT